MTKIVLILLFSTLFYSCRQHTNEKDKDSVKEGNKSMTLSTDSAKLSKIIDLTTYKPTNVKFQYIFINNSGQNERLSIPGPSDSYLQAALYFDSVTYRQFKTKYFSADYASPNYDRQDFNFEWLDANTKNELLQSDTNYHGHPDFFLGLGVKGKLWFLSNKVLLTNTID